MTWLDDLAAFVDRRLREAGRTALAGEVESDMAVLADSLARTGNPLWRLTAEVAVKGFILSAEIGPHRHLRREVCDRHGLDFAAPGCANGPVVDIPVLAGLDATAEAESHRFRKIRQRLYENGIEAELAVAPGGGALLRLAWPADVFAGKL